MAFMVVFCVMGAFAAPEKGTMMDSRDGMTYRTVKIGKQVWTAENLNHKTENSYCYKDDEANCSKYGRLYTWKAAQKACPVGWHLPSEEEFKTLFETVGGEAVAGKILKSTSGWKENGNGDDTFGFSALPAGCKFDKVNFIAEGNNAGFWSSTEHSRLVASSMGLDVSVDNANLFVSNDKNYGFSVRCLKD